MSRKTLVVSRRFSFSAYLFYGSRIVEDLILLTILVSVLGWTRKLIWVFTANKLLNKSCHLIVLYFRCIHCWITQKVMNTSAKDDEAIKSYGRTVPSINITAEVRRGVKSTSWAGLRGKTGHSPSPMTLVISAPQNMETRRVPPTFP